MRTPSTAAGDQSAPPVSAPGQRIVAAAGRLPGLARAHWLFTLLLAAGLALRVLTQIAYRPALLFIDSTKYLFGAYPGDDPPGYRYVLKLLLPLANLALVAVAQHLLGLAIAITVYVVLLRRGVPRWLSALATAPVLLDGYQLQIEQNIMPDIMFETLIVVGLVALLWRPRPKPWMIVVAGLAFGASATARQVGEILILPALLYVLIAVPGARRRAGQAVLLCATFAFPILFVSYTNYVSIHSFSLAPHASGTIYGRMAVSANCATLQIPSYERPLCPTPQQQRLGPDALAHGATSPAKSYRPPPGLDRLSVVRNFDRQVLLQQPLNVAGGIAKDALKLFAVDRVTNQGDTPISRWQFQPGYPLFPPYVTVNHGTIVFGTIVPSGAVRILGTGQRFGASAPVAVRPLAAFLRAYQLDGGYTPGPLFLLTAIAGLAGSLLAFRRRATPARRAASQACLLIFTAGVGVVLASDVFEFSWRYQLPALFTLPPAAALAITAVLYGRRSVADDTRNVVPDALVPGRGEDNDRGERPEYHPGPPAGRLLDEASAGERADDDSGERTQAPGKPVRLGAGHQASHDPRESAGQIGT